MIQSPEIPANAEYVIDKPWTEIRESFRTGSFRRLCQQLLPQIKKWESNPEAKPDPEQVKAQSAEQVEKVKQFYDEFENQNVQKKDKGNKIHFTGINQPAQETLTRIYIGVDSTHSADAFLELFAHLQTSGVLNSIEIAYNTEAVEGSQTPTNSIVMYDPTSRPEVLTKIAEAYKQSKKAKPDAFSLSPNQRAAIMKANLMQFKNTLDANFAFVEIPKEDGGQTYDSGVIHQTQNSFGINPILDTQLDVFIDKVVASKSAFVFDKKTQQKLKDGTVNRGDTLEYKRKTEAPGLVEYGTVTVK